MADHNNPQSRTEEILIATIDGTEYNKLPQSRLEELLLELKEVIEAGGGGGGTTNYNNLSNLPKINNVIVKGEMTASDLSLVLAEVGKGLSTNDYSDEEKAKVANLLAAIEGILTGSDIDSFGDVESALANKVDKVNGKGLSTNDFTDTYKDAVDANTTAITAIKDGTDIDSFGDVEVALLDKADTSDLGTAAAKDSTNSVTAGSTDLVESGAVKDAIDSAVSRSYHHAGTKTVAQLTHDLLIAANEGNVYNITDSGTTTSDFIEGIGKPIKEGANVGVAKVSDGVYMFDLLSGFVDTSLFVQKSQTSGLLKNDGTVNTTIEDTVAGHTTALAGKQDKYETITYAQWQAMTPEQQAAKDYYISDYPSSVLTAGNIAYDNTTSGMAANKVQGAIDELKSGLITPSSGYKKLGSGAIDSGNPVIVSLGNNNISDYDVLYFCVSYYDSGVATYGSLTIPTTLVKLLYNSDAGVVFMARNATYDDIVGVGVVLDTNNNTIRFAPSAQPAGVYYVVYGVKWRASN